jgi:hypothetical protein
MVDELHRDELDFWYAVCDCGYRSTPVPDIDILVDEMMAHADSSTRADLLDGPLRVVGEGQVRELEIAGTQYLWRCRNCGDSHDEGGCDDPDLFDYNTYRIVDAALVPSDPPEEKT